MKYSHILLFLLLFILSCSDDQGSEETGNINSTPVIEKPVEKVKLYATMDHLRVRKEADLGSETVYMLSENEEVEFLEVQENGENIPVKLRGFRYQDPWIKIRTTDGTEGWVYGGGVKYKDNSKIAKILQKSRMEALFGKGIAPLFADYKSKFDRVNTSIDMAEVFRMGKSLRDTTENIMHEKIEVSDPQKLPDLSWLSDAFPGYVSHLVAEGTMFHSFIDFKEFAKKARRTTGTEDDKFMELGMKIFPIDSIEHFYPAWFMQTWDYGGHSELGAGVHNRLLDEMNRILAESPLFENEIETYKDQLIHDITDSHVTYWQPKDAILKELDEIIAADYGILNEEDKIALKTRRKLFENPSANGIQVNHRSGVHN